MSTVSTRPRQEADSTARDLRAFPHNQRVTTAIATSGAFSFSLDRLDHVDPTEPSADFVAWHLQLDGPGEVEVARSGFDGLGPWAVDIYRPSSNVLAVEEARRWAHAILAAADYAEGLEQGEQQPPC